jgi:L-ribulokinase
VLGSSQGPALGAAIHAAVAAGCYDDVAAAADKMGKRRDRVYEPDSDRAQSYDRLYAVYVQLHDWFGRDNRGLMRDLQEIREQATEGS